MKKLYDLQTKRTSVFLLKAIMISLLLISFFVNIVEAAVSVTTSATGGTGLSADNAANSVNPLGGAYTTLGKIVITEGKINDFPKNNTNKTFTIKAPNGWQFKNLIPDISVASSKDISSISIAYTDIQTYTVTWSTPNGSGGEDAIDVITIGNTTPIQIIATDGYKILELVNLTLSENTPRVVVGLNGLTCGSLSQTFGTMTKLVVTLPGQTFTDGNTMAASGNSGTAANQTVGTSFNIAKLTATDQFFNIITSYTGTKTLAYSGPATTGTAGGTAPSYTNEVNFTNGQSTTTLATTLYKAETPTITVTDGVSFGTASSSLVVDAKPITITPVADQTKVYGETDPTPFNYSSTPLIGSDAITGSMDRVPGENVNTYIFTIGTLTANANYSLSVASTPTFSITPKPLTVPDAAAANKIYDGTVAATITGTLNSVINSDDVTLIGTGTFNDRNVGTNKIVTSTSTLDGADAGNYSLTQPTGLTADITVRPITVAANTDSKEYDGTTSSSVAPTVPDLQTGDAISTAPTQSFDTPDIGSDKVLTASGLVINDGNNGNNYDISYTTNTGEIVAPTSVTWAGNTSTEWSTIENWAPTYLPTSSVNVIIPDVSSPVNSPIVSTSDAVCNNLIIQPKGQLEISTGATLTMSGTCTINSSALDANGSLIVLGTLSTNTVTYNRYMTGGRWYITSAPVNVTSGFGTTNSSKIVSHGTPIVDYDFADYTEANNAGWQYKTTIPEGLTPGQGYLVTLGSSNTLAFTGALNPDPVNISVANTGEFDGWNAVGNPYTSAIKVVGTGGFLDVNSGVLATSYAAVYVWNESGELGTYDGSQQYYKAISNSGYTPQINGSILLDGVNNIQVGQGFLINANASSSVTFTKAMQVSDPTLTLKSAETSWPGITLLAEANGKTRSTVVAFNEQMTTGLDVTYDAGLLASDYFQVYTRLVGGNNEVDFAVQCLPENQYNQLAVPVGIDLPEGGDLVFKASGVILRDGLFPVIEDRLLGIQTALKTATDSYTVTLDKNTSGTGRFYLSVADVTTSKPAIRQENKYTASLVNNRIILNGAVEAGTKATLYDICGRKVGEYPLAKMNRNEIPVSGLSQRVYLLKVEGSNYRQVMKLMAINF
jgi:hypothetical protein